jgi:hypothetical protein
MLAQFESWIQEKRQEIDNLGYQMDILKSPSDVDRPSLRLDLDSDNYIARITLWDCGECQLEIIDVLSERMVLDEYLEIDANVDFNKVFENFVNKLR